MTLLSLYPDHGNPETLTFEESYNRAAKASRHPKFMVRSGAPE